MPYVCGACDYFDGDGTHTSNCPSCGGRMRFTLLDSRATATATLDPPSDAASGSLARAKQTAVTDKPDWANPYINGYEEIEPPLAYRWARVGVGIGTYYVMWRWGRVLLSIVFVLSLEERPTVGVAILYLLTLIALKCVAAIAAGAVAGIWTRKWLPQGLAVAAGVLIIPILGAMIEPPEEGWLFLLPVVITTTLAIGGAYLGHRLVRPTRIPIS